MSLNVSLHGCDVIMSHILHDYRVVTVKVTKICEKKSNQVDAPSQL